MVFMTAYVVAGLSQARAAGYEVQQTSIDNGKNFLVFSAPGFENLMRCESVLPNEKSTPLSPEQYKECDHQGHVIYKDPEWKNEKAK